MPTPVIDNLIETSVHARRGASEFVNVFYSACPNSAPNITDLNNAASAVGTAYDDNLDAFHTSIRFDYVYSRSLQGSSSLSYTSVFADDTTGTETSAALPSPIAAVITHRSSFIGRSHRGRTFTFGLAINFGTIDTCDEVYILKWFNLISEIETNLDGSDQFLAIASLKYLSYVPVQAITSDGIYRVQRRRELGVGS